MTPTSRSSVVRRLACGAALVVTALAGTPARPQAQAAAAGPAILSLADPYRLGGLLRDRNGDAVADSVAAALMLGATPSADELAAAADIAARLGFETMAMDLPLGREPSADGVAIAVGAAGLARAGVDAAAIGAAGLRAGEGLVTITAVGTRPVVAIAGGDDAGVRAAAETFAGRVPFVWGPKGIRLQKIADDVAAWLAGRGITPASTSVVAIRTRAGGDALERVVIRAAVPAAAVAKARAALVATRPVKAPTAAARVAKPGPAATPVLSYPGARAIEVQLIADGGAPVAVTLARVGDPPPDVPPGRRPGAAAKESLDLSSLFGIDGLLGDSDSNLIPDRLDAVVSPADGSVDAVVDLAGRIGLESTGVSLPAVIPAASLGKPEDQPTLVIIGGQHPQAQALVKAGKWSAPALAPGQGVIQVVRKAFGEKRAVVVAGGDADGVGRAVRQMAERFPHLWQRGKDRTTLDDVENDVRRFLGGRTPAGQAAMALYKLDRIVAALPAGPIERARVHVYVEKADAGFDRVIRERLAGRVPAQSLEVTVEDLDVQRARTIVDERFEVASEVEAFWSALRREVIPKVRRGQPVTVEARLSEPPEVRARLAREALAELVKAGVDEARSAVVVLSAYKQGFSWLYDIVRPQLAGKPLGHVTIRFAEIGPPAEWKQQAMFTPSRWLHEIFPIDEVLARDLKLPLAAITFEKLPIGSPIYEVVATGPDGAEILRQTFEPKYVLRSYFDRFPDYEKVRVTTGWITARTGPATLVDRRIPTDLETFWDHFQGSTLATMYDYVMANEKGKPQPDHAPFFGELTVDLSLSEPDYRLGIDNEQIASMEAMHEEVYFATLHFFDVLGRYTRGRALEYPGRVIPVMRPKADGRPGRASIKLTGFGASRPSVVVEYTAAGGRTGTLELDIPAIGVERPAAMSATVADGREGLEALSLQVKVDSERDERDALVVRARAERVDAQVISAEQVGAVVANLSALRAAGLYRAALAYHQLGTLQIVAHWTHDAAAAVSRTFALEPNGVPAPFPDSRTLLPAGYRYAGGPIVQWDTPIPPPEAYQLLAKMAATFPEATTYKLGQSYLGKDVWAMDVMPRIESSHWSQAKATTLKPTAIYSARQHANEVSSTSHTLKFAELLLTDPEFRKALNRVNVVFHPITNPDGAQLAYDLYTITPDHMLHAGYLGSLGVDMTNGQWDEDPIYPESKYRADLWRTWLPDIFLNPHGYPSHEWVQLFSEYAGWVRNRVTEARDWWGMRGWFTPGFGYVDDPKYPRHKEAAFRIRDLFSRNVNAPPDVRALNERAYARYRRYGFDHDRANFKLDFTNDVLIYSAIKGAKASAQNADFMVRNPAVTVWTGSTEAPDETAHGDWMTLVATAGLQWDKAILQYLLEGDHKVERKEEAFHGGISLSLNRPRPPKPPETPAPATTGEGPRR